MNLQFTEEMWANVDKKILQFYFNVFLQGSLKLGSWDRLFYREVFLYNFWTLKDNILMVLHNTANLVCCVELLWQKFIFAIAQFCKQILTAMLH